MKIDGQQQWVRRRDLGPGQTTAGDMLQNSNEHSKRMVLGKQTDAFNTLTGKGGKYEKDPQGAVRKLLGDPLPPSATAPRPIRGPAPKPVTPAPKAEPKASAPVPTAPKAPTTEAFITSKQAMPAKAKLTPKDVSDGLHEFAQQEGLRGENMQKLLQFQQQNNIAVSWTSGSEKNAAAFSHLFTDEVKGSLDAAIARGTGRGIGVTKESRKELESGNLGAYTNAYLKVKRGADGHTADGLGTIVLRHASHDKAVGTTNGVNRVFNAVHQGILDAKGLKPGHSAAQGMYYNKGGKAGARMIADQGWVNTYIHEMGHQVHYAAGTPVMPFQGKEAVGWLPSKYGGTNGLERFAETFVQYVIDPEGLKAASPGAYKWVDEAMTKALKGG
jgi:hypothetical protein